MGLLARNTVEDGTPERARMKRALGKRLGIGVRTSVGIALILGAVMFLITRGDPVATGNAYSCSNGTPESDTPLPPLRSAVQAAIRYTF